MADNGLGKKVIRMRSKLVSENRLGVALRSYQERAIELAWEKIKGLPLIKKVQIQTHSSCNANCVFCPYPESWHAGHRGRMSDDLFEKVLQELRHFSYGINKGKVCPYLMQEPLLDGQIFERIEKIYEYFPGTLVEISTNALALNEIVATRLIKMLRERRHEILVSHHGIDKESIEFIMKIDYETATNNLLGFLKQADGNLNIKIRGAGVSGNGKIRFFDRDQYINYWKRLFERERINTSRVTVKACTFNDRAGTIYRKERNAHLNRVGIVRQIDREHPFYCERIDEWIHIMYNGTIRICCLDYHGEVKLPNIKDVSLVEYFRSSDFRNLAGMVAGNVKSPNDFICKRCSCRW